MPHGGAHGYIELRISSGTADAAVNEVRGMAMPSADLWIDTVSKMEQTDNGSGTRQGPGDTLILYLRASSLLTQDTAHARILAVYNELLKLKNGAAQRFAQGASHHWCCYSDQ